mgnify:CR=1 FL=1
MTFLIACNCLLRADESHYVSLQTRRCDHTFNDCISLTAVRTASITGMTSDCLLIASDDL